MLDFRDPQVRRDQMLQGKIKNLSHGTRTCIKRKKMPKIDTLDALEEHEEHEDDYQTNSN